MFIKLLQMTSLPNIFPRKSDFSLNRSQLIERYSTRSLLFFHSHVGRWRLHKRDRWIDVYQRIGLVSSALRLQPQSTVRYATNLSTFIRQCCGVRPRICNEDVKFINNRNKYSKYDIETLYIFLIKAKFLSNTWKYM